MDISKLCKRRAKKNYSEALEDFFANFSIIMLEKMKRTLHVPSVKTLGFLTKILDFPTKSRYLLIFLIRSWKVLLLSRNLELLDENLAKILTNESRNIQDYHEEFQGFLHWVGYVSKEPNFRFLSQFPNVKQRMSLLTLDAPVFPYD